MATTSHRDGLLFETLAALVLQFKGYRILARRYKTPVGEIDIVAQRGKVVVFCEVKGRATMDQALSSVTPTMQNRITRAAQYFIAGHPEKATFDLRFDLVALAPPFFWRHLDNAWRPAA